MKLLRTFIALYLVAWCVGCAPKSGTGSSAMTAADSIRFLIDRSRTTGDTPALKDAERAAKLAGDAKVNDTIVFAAQVNLGNVAAKSGNNALALSALRDALPYEKKSKPASVAAAYNQMGKIYREQGLHANALDCFVKALNIGDRKNDPATQAASFRNIGTVYHDQGKYEQAEEQYNLSLKLYASLGNRDGQADCFNNLGALYQNTEQYDKALEYYRKSEEIYSATGSNLLFRTECNIGQIYDNRGETEKAHEYYFRSLNGCKNAPDAKSEIAEIYNIIGMSYEDFGMVDSAVYYYNLAGETAQKLNLYESHQFALGRRALLYASKQRFREAYNDQVSANELYKQVNNKETVEKFVQKYMQYEFDRQQKEREYRERQQRLMIGILTVAVLLVCVVAVLIFRNAKQKERLNAQLNRANADLNQSNIQLNQAKIELEKTNVMLEETNTKLTDSINLAKLIQEAALPAKEYSRKVLHDHFVLYKPCHTVSGDFYWMVQKDNLIIVAAADCTGHGVPGALLSMLGMSSLNEIVSRQDIPQADVILNLLREKIKKFVDHSDNELIKLNGMDIALVIIDKDKQELEYAGANNSLLLIRDGEMTEKKADPMPIGLYVKEVPFAAERFAYRTGDIIYMYSDGYADQFGGPDDKKFFTKRLKRLIVAISDKPMAEQSRILNETHCEWKGKKDQTDDILVMGIKL